MKNGDRINILAIAVGWFVSSVVAGILVAILFIMAGMALGVSGAGRTIIEKQLSSSMTLKVATLALRFALTTLGGYLTARIAKRAEMQHAFLMGAVTMLPGLLPHLWSDLQFDWNQAVSLLAIIPFALLGGYLGAVSRKPSVGAEVTTEEKKRLRKRKIFIYSSVSVGGVMLFVAVISLFIFRVLPEMFFRVPKDLETAAVIKGEGVFSKHIFANMFLREKELGKITDILYRKVGNGLEIGIAGTKGAVFLDKNLQPKSRVAFSLRSQDINFIPAKRIADVQFLDRRHWQGSKCCFSSLIGHDGNTLWTYSGKSSVDDMAAGDLEGNGTTEFVVGLNGSGGIQLLDAKGRRKWEKPDANVWHVEIADTAGNGTLNIVHSDAGDNITVRDGQGKILSRKHLHHHFTDFSVTRWPGKDDKEYVLFSEKDKIRLIDFNGNDVAGFEAPRSSPFGYAKGVAAELRAGKPDYFAVLVDFDQWGRSCLYIYNPSEKLVYQEILPESCGAITAISSNGSHAETLLIGCNGKIWQYMAQN